MLHHRRTLFFLKYTVKFKKQAPGVIFFSHVWYFVLFLGSKTKEQQRFLTLLGLKPRSCMHIKEKFLKPETLFTMDKGNLGKKKGLRKVLV